MKRFIVVVLCALVVGLAACGGGGGAADSGGGEASAATGEEIFNQKLIGDAQPGCVTCHSLEPGVTMVGPSLAGIASVAGDRVSDQSAEEYLHNSIVNPDDHIVEGFDEGTMPAAIGEALSEQQVDDLVAYLMTLE